MGETRSHGAAVAVLVGVLLLAGALEAAASILRIASDGARSVVEGGGPAALVPVTAAVLLAVLGGRGARIVAFFGAVTALLIRLACGVVLMVPGGRFSIPEVLLVVSGAVTGLAVAALALHLVVRHHDLADRAQEPGDVEAHRPPVSPSTPVDLGLRARASGAWATASTPWPRVDEYDPDATLIRPPRR